MKYLLKLNMLLKNIEPITQKARIACKKGITLGNQGKYDDAIESFKEAVKIDPLFGSAWNKMGIAFYKIKKPKDAIKAFDKAIKIDSKISNTKIAEIWNNKGLAFYELGKPEDAIKAFDKAIKIDSKMVDTEIADIFNNYGVSLNELGEYDHAIEAYEKAIEKNPKLSSAYSNLGFLFLNLGNLDAASKKIDEALVKNDINASVLSLQGLIKIEEEDYDSASEYFKKAISLDMGEPLLIIWDAYANYLKADFSNDSKDEKFQAKMVSIIRKLEKAENICKKLDKEEINAFILYFLGYSYYKSKDIFAAKEKLQECLKLKSSIKSSASELLENIWNYQIRPSLLHWWLDSPLHRWLKRFIFIFLSVSIFTLLLVHPLIVVWFPFYQINETIYIFTIILLIFILFFPSIESIKTMDIEIKMRSPPISKFDLSAAKLGEKLF